MADVNIATNAHSSSDFPGAGAIQGPFSHGNDMVWFFIDDQADLIMRRTTDGTVAGGSNTTIRTGTVVAIGAFYDGADPASTGTTVHLVAVDSGTSTFVYYAIDVDTGTVGSAVTLDTSTGGAFSGTHCAITKSRSGNLVAAYVVDGSKSGTFLSIDDGATFSSMTSLVESNAFDYMYGVAVSTGQDSDAGFLFGDRSASAVSIKIWDGSSWNETAIAGTIELNNTANAEPYFAGVARRSDGLIHVVILNATDDAGGDLLSYTIDTTSGAAAPTVTQTTNVYTDLNSGGVGITINPANNRVYAFTCSGNIGAAVDMKYYISTDTMATWGSAQAFSADASADHRLTGPVVCSSAGGWFMPAWFDDDDNDVITNQDNRVQLGADPVVSVALTGSIVPSATEDAVAAGALTLIATIANSTWHADIDNDAAVSEDFISALVSAGAEALGWNNIVVGKFYRKEVLADNPLTYLRLGGNVTDQGSVGQNGTPTALTTGAALLLSSAQASSVFNASTAKVALSSPSGLDNLWDGGGTVEVVIRPWASGFSLDQSKIYSKIDGGAGWELILDNQAGGYIDLSLRVDFSTMQGVWKVPGKIPVGVQTHVAVTYNADSASNNPTFYINGVPYTIGSGLNEETTPSGTRSSDASSNLWVGSNSSAAVTYNGEMQEVALYGTALSATRVQAHVLAASYAYGLSYADLTRTSASVITLTMPVFPFYDITVAETITATFPTTTNFAAQSLVASPTFQITPTTRKTNFTPPSNPFNPNNQSPGPFGNVNGGLGPAAGSAFHILGAGDQWVVGVPQMSIGLGGSTAPRVVLVRATEITEVES